MNKFKLIFLCIGPSLFLNCLAEEVYCPSTVYCPTATYSDCKIENDSKWIITGDSTVRPPYIYTGTYKLIGAWYNNNPPGTPLGAACIYQYQPSKVAYVRSTVVAENPVDGLQIEPDYSTGFWVNDFSIYCGSYQTADPVPVISPEQCSFKRVAIN